MGRILSVNDPPGTRVRYNGSVCSMRGRLFTVRGWVDLRAKNADGSFNQAQSPYDHATGLSRAVVVSEHPERWWPSVFEVVEDDRG